MLAEFLPPKTTTSARENFASNLMGGWVVWGEEENQENVKERLLWKVLSCWWSLHFALITNFLSQLLRLFKIKSSWDCCHYLFINLFTDRGGEE